MFFLTFWDKTGGPDDAKMSQEYEPEDQEDNKNREIKTIFPIIIKEVDLLAKKENNLSFENLLKLAMNHLDKNSSNLAI